jgi:HPt (histidine-containing phosphotransfer) domain-containing protein
MKRLSKKNSFYSIVIIFKDMEGDNGEMSAIQIEGLDTEKGIRFTGGTLDYYLKVLSAFYDDGAERVETIAQCLAEGNIPLYTIHVHALKSVLASIGAKALSHSALSLETAGKQENTGYINSHNPAFMTQLEDLLNKIKTALPEAETEQETVITDETELLLVQLKNALTELDFHAIQGLSLQLRGFAALQKTILLSNYDEAVGLIEKTIHNNK